MAVEIERKFLVATDGWRESAGAPLQLEQGYLGGDRCSIRVRITGSGANARCDLNIKSRDIGTTRQEFEYEIPLDEARDLIALCGDKVIAKRRYHVPCSHHTWEVDEFLGANAGLVVAEIELDDAEEAFERPPWLGGEVTDDERYYNNCLAEHPWRTWPSK